MDKALSKPQAKAALRRLGAFWRPRFAKGKKRLRGPATIIELNQHVCELIVLAQGPTFFSISSGQYRCNQTNKVLNPNQLKGYQQTIFQLAYPKDNQSNQSKTENLLTIEVTNLNSQVRCPHCHLYQWLTLGVNRCRECRRHFMVNLLDKELKKKEENKEGQEVPIAQLQNRIRGNVYVCPHCGIGIMSFQCQTGINTCWSCEQNFRVK